VRPALSRRLAAALTVGAATTAQRERILAAGKRARAYADLPDDVRALVERLEAR